MSPRHLPMQARFKLPPNLTATLPRYILSCPHTRGLQSPFLTATLGVPNGHIVTTAFTDIDWDVSLRAGDPNPVLAQRTGWGFNSTGVIS